jgi:hypothetical protein
MRHSRRAIAVAAALLAVAAAPAHAHIRSSTGYSEIRQQGGTVHYALGVEYGPLSAAVGLQGRTLEQARGLVQGYLASRLIVSVDGVQCEGSLARTAVEHREAKRFARLELEYECPGSPTGAFGVRYGVLADGGVIDDHRSIVDYSLGGRGGTFVFDSGHHELAAGSTGALTDARRFVTMGVGHILSGIDHVLSCAGFSSPSRPRSPRSSSGSTTSRASPARSRPPPPRSAAPRSSTRTATAAATAASRASPACRCPTG